MAQSTSLARVSPSVVAADCRSTIYLPYYETAARGHSNACCTGVLVCYWVADSVTKRENLTILASDDNGEHFTRSLQIVPPGPPSKSGFPTPGTGYSQLQCGLPPPLDCAVAYDDGQEFNYAFPYCNISWVRFSSKDVV